jgi:hypothetical protein
MNANVKAMTDSDTRHYMRLFPALAIKQPWAFLITRPDLTDPDKRKQECKNIENRSRRSHRRTWFLVHASKAKMTAEAFDCAMEVIQRGIGLGRLPQSVADVFASKRFDSYELGGITGMAKLGACVTGSSSPWFMGEYGYVLDEIRPLPFVACTGMLGFFKASA